MEGLFKEIYKKETNEATALILMLGVLGEKLTDIANLMSTSNTLLNEILLCLKKQKVTDKKEYKPMLFLSREDFD